MYTVKKSIDIDFAHHVDGHLGPCINIHGHTWKFELEVEAEELDEHGFVIDFGDLKREVLQPVHQMLDHGLLISEATIAMCSASLTQLGRVLTNTRNSEDVAALERIGAETNRWLFRSARVNSTEEGLNGAYDVDMGGMKVIIFPQAPTSERIARWLARLADKRLVQSGRYVNLYYITASIYETMHPVNSVASYRLLV
jgi:6-pyruvoyl tetrahydropterin synthase/QueD family protein